MTSTAFSTIYVTGLPRHITSWELAEICRPYGEVIAAQVENDPETGTPWQFGFVEFSAPESASRAAAALHGKRYRGDVLAARQIDQANPEQLEHAPAGSPEKRRSRRVKRTRSGPIERSGTDSSVGELSTSKPYSNRR